MVAVNEKTRVYPQDGGVILHLRLAIFQAMRYAPNMRFISDVYLDYGVSRHDPELGFGRHQANYRLIEAIIKHNTLFDEFHFVRLTQLPESQKTAIENHLSALTDKPIHWIDPFRLIDWIQSTPPDTICHRFDPNLAQLIYYRDHFAPHPFPITGVTHSLHAHHTREILLKLFLSSYQPFDALVCTTETAMTMLQKSFDYTLSHIGLPHQGKPIITHHRIPLCVDTAQFCPRLSAQKELRLRLHIPRDKIVFTSLSRLTPYDKMELIPLLDAFRIAVNESNMGVDAHLVIIGREQQPGYLNVLQKTAGEMGIAQQVQFITQYDGGDIPLWHAMSDCFVSISDHIQETFGLTVVEAMASGVPVITSDWNGYKDTVIHGQTGFRVPTYWANCLEEIDLRAPLLFDHEIQLRQVQSVAVDVPYLAATIKRLLENRSLRHTIGQQARTHAQSTFSEKSVVIQYEALWRDLVDSACHAYRPKSPANLLTWDTHHIYGHYPTTSINHQTFLGYVTTKNALYKDVIKTIDPTVVNKIMAYMEKKQRSTMGELTQAIPNQPALSYTVMVLIKYNLLRVIPH